MGKMLPAEQIRIVHRWSGLVLFFCIGIKLISGLTLSGKIAGIEELTANWMHFSKWVDVPLVLAFSIHAAYGILKIWMGRGIENKDRALRITNSFAGIFFLIIIYFVFK